MLIKIVALVLPLGLDTFVVAAALGVAGLAPSRRMRVSLVMAGFEAAMPLVGLALGAPLGRAIGSTADYLAVGLLITFALYMLLASDGEEERVARLAELSGWRAGLLGIGISLDELALGFTFGLLRLPIVPVIILIAAQALAASQLGMRVGARLSAQAREAAERLGGVALLAVGLVLLSEKLFA